MEMIVFSFKQKKKNYKIHNTIYAQKKINLLKIERNNNYKLFLNCGFYILQNPNIKNK